MDIINIATEEYGIEDAEIVNVLFLEKESREETIKILAKNGHPVATLTFSNSEKQGKGVRKYKNFLCVFFVLSHCIVRDTYLSFLPYRR